MTEYYYKCTLCLSIFVLLLFLGMRLDSYARLEMSQAQVSVEPGQRAGPHAKRLSASSLKSDTLARSEVIFMSREYVKVLK